ncbi:unnamed protein product, partial [Ectocarpus sp. 8 AP-2014]
RRPPLNYPFLSPPMSFVRSPPARGQHHGYGLDLPSPGPGLEQQRPLLLHRVLFTVRVTALLFLLRKQQHTNDPLQPNAQPLLDLNFHSNNINNGGGSSITDDNDNNDSSAKGNNILPPLRASGGSGGVGDADAAGPVASTNGGGVDLPPPQRPPPSSKARA